MRVLTGLRGLAVGATALLVPACGGSEYTVGGGTGGAASEPFAESGVEIASGPRLLVDLFVSESGIYEITEFLVRLLEPDGTELRRVDYLGRSIRAAAFDGELLVVSGDFGWTSYDSELFAVATTGVESVCSAMAQLGSGAIVCGDRYGGYELDTFDLRTGALLGTADLSSLAGPRSFRAVPDSAFIVETAAGGYRLLAATSPTEVSVVGEQRQSGYGAAFGFAGAPVHHLVTTNGSILRLDETCDPSAAVSGDQCLQGDGTRVLTANQRFAGVDADRAGTIYGLVDSGDGGGCPEECLLERFVGLSTEVDARLAVRLYAHELVAFRVDPSGGVLVGYGPVGESPVTPYRVRRLYLPP
jgi:hypothetical protein